MMNNFHEPLWSLCNNIFYLGIFTILELLIANLNKENLFIFQDPETESYCCYPSTIRLIDIIISKLELYVVTATSH